MWRARAPPFSHWGFHSPYQTPPPPPPLLPVTSPALSLHPLRRHRPRPPPSPPPPPRSPLRTPRLLLAPPRTLGALGPWHARAAHLALLACGYEERTRCGEMGVPDRPYSLYEGVAGMCAAWADVVCVLDGKVVGGMVGFADLLPSGIGLSTPY